MSAPAVHIPSPRRPVGSIGRHHAAVGFSPAAQTFTVLARAGSLTTLAAMVVLASAVAGLVDGTPPTGSAADAAVSGLER